MEYLNDVETAVSCLCITRDYLAAMSLCEQTERNDLKETVFSHLENESKSVIAELEEKRAKLKRVANRLHVLQEKEQEKHEPLDDQEGDKESDAASVWTQSTAATGISAVTGMTAFFEPGRTANVLGVSPVEDIAALSHRAGNTAIHSRRSVKVMQFGNSVSKPEKESKKKRRIREGSPQEKEALVKMAEILMKWEDEEEEVDSLTESLYVFQRQKLAKMLQMEWREYIDCVKEAGSEIKMERQDVTLKYQWLGNYICFLNKLH